MKYKTLAAGSVRCRELITSAGGKVHGKVVLTGEREGGREGGLREREGGGLRERESVSHNYPNYLLQVWTVSRSVSMLVAWSTG